MNAFSKKSASEEMMEDSKLGDLILASSEPQTNPTVNILAWAEILVAFWGGQLWPGTASC